MEKEIGVEIKILENDKVMEVYKELEDFLKFLDDEIKKIDVGDEDAS